MTRVIATAALVVLTSGDARAQAPEPATAVIRITLPDAVERGLATSHRLAEAAARGEIAQAVADGRHAAALPQVAAQAGYTRTNHVDEFGLPISNNQLRIIYPDIPDNYRSRLDLQWPIYTGGRVDALERAARGEATAATHDLEAARADLRLEITRAYWALVTATELRRVVDQSVARIAAHLTDVRHQFDVGLVPPNDVSTVEAQASRERMFGVQARTIRDVAEAQLAYLIGAPSGTPIVAVAALDAPSTRPADGMDALQAAARRQRPERAALDTRLTAAGERTRAARAGTLPTVAVGGGVDFARPNPRIFPRVREWNGSWDASVNVNWLLFDGGRARADIAEATAATRVVQERLAEFDATLDLELRQRASELVSSRAAIEAAEDGVRAATEAGRVVGDRFAAGVATSTDVLDAQVALLQAQVDRTQAVAAARLAEARLARALGQ
jgi:outer membrane protein TolC